MSSKTRKPKKFPIQFDDEHEVRKPSKKGKKLIPVEKDRYRMNVRNYDRYDADNE